MFLQKIFISLKAAFFSFTALLIVGIQTAHGGEYFIERILMHDDYVNE